jgi:hypothetical protein
LINYNEWSNRETRLINTYLINNESLYLKATQLATLSRGKGELAGYLENLVGPWAACRTKLLIADIDSSSWETINWKELAHKRLAELREWPNRKRTR